MSSHWIDLFDLGKYPYHIVVSSRAKYLRLRMTNDGKLSVVLPRRLDEHNAHRFVQAKKIVDYETHPKY